jgi:hypothetical protein
MKRQHVAVAFIAFVALLLPAIPAKAIWGSSPIDRPGKYPYVGAAWLRTNCCYDNPPGEDPGSYNFVMPNPPLYPFYDADGDGDADPEELEGPKVRVNGILIAPNVVLTQGGYFRNGRRLAVSFREQIIDESLTLDPTQPYPPADFYPGNIAINVGPDGVLGPLPNPFIIDPRNVAKFDVGAADIYEGYAYQMPGLNEEENGFVTNDLAVIILDKNVTGVPLVKLSAPGALDQKNALRVSVISYGPQGEEPDLARDADGDWKDDAFVEELLSPYTFWDFSQRQSQWTVTKVEGPRVRLEALQPSYYCDADEGAPFIDDKTGEVAALMTFWPDFCNDKIAYGYRLDTREVYNFLCDVGNGKLVDVPNSNPAPGDLYLNDDEGVQPKGVVDYPDVTSDSRTTLHTYCDAS